MIVNTTLLRLKNLFYMCINLSKISKKYFKEYKLDVIN